MFRQRVAVLRVEQPVKMGFVFEKAARESIKIALVA